MPDTMTVVQWATAHDKTPGDWPKLHEAEVVIYGSMDSKTKNVLRRTWMAEGTQLVVIDPEMYDVRVVLFPKAAVEKKSKEPTIPQPDFEDPDEIVRGED